MIVLRILCLAAPCALSLTGCATDDEALEDPLARFERTGETTSCLPPRAADSIDAIGDNLLLIRDGSDYYLNETKGNCGAAQRPGYRFEYTLRGGQLCSNQIVRVVDGTSEMTAGSCGLGEFERLVEKPADDNGG